MAYSPMYGGFIPQNNGYGGQTPQYANLVGQQVQVPQNANNGFTQPVGVNGNNLQAQFGGNISISYVNGIEGAKAQIMPPNAEMWLLDSEGSFIYHKSTDYIGKAVIKPYLLNEVTEDYVRKHKQGQVTAEPVQAFVAIEDYKKDIESIRKELNELKNRKNNVAGGKQ